MSEIKISESRLRVDYISYILNSLSSVMAEMRASKILKTDSLRQELILTVPEEFKSLLTLEAEDKMADVIAIGYKYAYFKRNIAITALGDDDKELLYAALIAADADEDKRYVKRKLKNFSEYSIDGIFNFRMKPLKEKWSDIAGYVPKTFTKSQVKDFITYLIKDKRGKRVCYDGRGLYDKYFNRLTRSMLMGEGGETLKVAKEIILSGAGEVELLSPLPEKDEPYIKEYYGDRVIFSGEYFKRG